MYVLKSQFIHLRSKYPSPISSTTYYRLNLQERSLYEEDKPDMGTFTGSHSYTPPDTTSSFLGSEYSPSSDSVCNDSPPSFDYGGGDSGGGGASGEY